MTRVSDPRKYSVIAPTTDDNTLATELYMRCPVQGYDIKAIKVLHSEQMAVLFTGIIY